MKALFGHWIFVNKNIFEVCVCKHRNILVAKIYLMLDVKRWCWPWKHIFVVAGDHNNHIMIPILFYLWTALNVIYIYINNIYIYMYVCMYACMFMWIQYVLSQNSIIMLCAWCDLIYKIFNEWTCKYGCKRIEIKILNKIKIDKFSFRFFCFISLFSQTVCS